MVIASLPLKDHQCEKSSTLYLGLVCMLWQIHANCRIRRVYFSDRLYSEEELPTEFKLYLPVPKKWTRVTTLFEFQHSSNVAYIIALLARTHLLRIYQIIPDLVSFCNKMSLCQTRTFNIWHLHRTSTAREPCLCPYDVSIFIQIVISSSCFKWPLKPESCWCRFDVNRSTFQFSLRYARKRLLHFRSHLLSFDLKITSPFTSARSNILIKYELFTAFQLWVNEGCRHKYRKKRFHFRWWNVFDDVCRMERGSLCMVWSWLLWVGTWTPHPPFVA